MIIVKDSYRLMGGGLVVLSTACGGPANRDTPSENRKPNIVLLLLDDAGYADFGFMGSPDLKTPHIDRLAGQGVVFSDAHVSATVCGPSRAGIMTGRYQQRFGFECNPTGDSCVISRDETTLASALKGAGYITAAFGKWHLGELPGYRPNERGFDYYWGFLAGGRSYFPDERMDVAGDPRAITENSEPVAFEGYLTDRLGEKAADFIERNKEKPFFIYWAPNAVHTPMEATPEDLALFEGHPRQTLAAMTWALDRAVGKIADELEKNGLLENTLIFFLSDNGGAHNNQSSNFPLKGFKGNKFEGGHRVPFFVTWPAKIKGGQTFSGLTSSLDIFATAIDAAGINPDKGLPPDGVSLVPYLKAEKKGSPHQQLFWRKDAMAAVRSDRMKLIRVEKLPSVVYNLSVNLGETINLAADSSALKDRLESALEQWEEGLAEPLWTEGATWDTITWMIHQDLMSDRRVRVKSPAELIKYTQNQKK